MKRVVLLFTAVMLSVLSYAQTIRYVKQDATGNGTSWADASGNLQAMMDSSAVGDQVWVAQGTYKPTEKPDGVTSTEERDKAFHLNKDIALYGGFAGTETAPSDRTAGHETILSGDFDGDDSITGSGATLSITNNDENAYHVMITANLTAAAIIDGFTFTGGNADGSGSYTYSGKTFHRFEGGGQYNVSSSPIFTSCTFTGNSANSNGGGQYNEFSSPSFTSCTFTGNSAYKGGGQCNLYSSSPILTSCTFTGNSASGFGGGQCNASSSPNLTSCTFTGNRANSYGGGQCNLYSSSPSLTNCTFMGNSANSYGGGQCNLYSSSPSLTNCTFTGNSASYGGGQYNKENSSPKLTNCIVWGNTASSNGNNVHNYDSSTPTFKHCIVQGCGGSSWNSSFGTDGGNNLDADPLFLNPNNPAGADGIHRTADDGLRLQIGSPAIDAGTSEGITHTTDITGANLIDTPDIGAYEGGVVKIIYVNTNATGTGDGTSWADAYTDLQPAIDEANVGNQVWVAQGTYKPTEIPDDAGSSDNRDKAFHLNKDIALYGGFAGTETALSDRTAGHETILSGDFGNNDVITGSGATLSITGNTENAHHVMITANLTAAAIIDGFTFTGGNANNETYSYYTYSGKTFYRYLGGGQHNSGSSPNLTSCTFTGNSANGGGGGQCNFSDSSPNLTNCTFTGNSANYGGGQYNEDSSPNLTSCIFTGNSANDGGGQCNQSSSPILTSCTFTGNSANGDGGGQCNYSSSPILTNCTFTGNSANYGGGQFNQSSSPILTNCTFTGNSANNRGGGQYNLIDSSPILTNCTFTGNSADKGGGQYNYYSSSPSLSNCIVWGNTATNGGDNVYNDSSTPTFKHCIVQGCGGSGSWNATDFGTDGGNNLDADPLFLNPNNPAGADGIHRTADDGLRLQIGSPAIDKGTTVSHTTDITGAAHIGTPDIGAYEGGVVPIYVNIAATGKNDGTSWADAYTDLQPAIDAASAGNHIWVAQGTYKPTETPDGVTGTNDRDKAFHLDKNIALYGGFAGTETALNDRTAGHETILSGDFDGDDSITGSGATLSITNNDENAYHVMITANLTANAIIDGFTFTGGNANGDNNYTYSGKTFYRYLGGGQYNCVSSPILTNCTFTGNSANGDGGGQCNYSSSPSLTNCTFTGNSAGYGGGQCNSDSSPNLTSCTFTGNSANGDGGGQCNYGSSSPSLTSCTFTGNRANNEGGGQYNLMDSSPNLTSCTFTGNSANNKGGGQCNYYFSSPSLTNCIVWGNTASSNGNNVHNYDSTPTFKHCIVQGCGGSSWNSGFGTDGGGNLDADPLFLNPNNPAGADGIHRTADDGLRLQIGSPAIDAGTSEGITHTTDITGANLIGTPDIGAYEGGVVPIYVNIAATGKNDGTSWADAYTDLQPAIDAASAGNHIWVAQGTYKPTETPDGVTSSDDRDKAFHLDKDIALYGGFAGTETAPSDRTAGHETILSGDFGNNDVITGSGATLSITGNTENAHHVMITANLTAAAIIDGFTFTGGNANGSGNYTCSGRTFYRNYGGGQYNVSSSPSFTNCTFTGNSASYQGGGQYNVESSSPILSNCTFTGNSANNGGGQYNGASSPNLTSCTFTGNSANNAGGGQYNEFSSPILTSCTFTGNSANNGGGQYNRSSSSLKLTDCTFTGNSANSDGGGQYNFDSSSPNLTNCTFTGNSANSDGGGQCSLYSSSPSLTNCIVWGNTARSNGNNVHNVNNSTPTFKHCIVQGSSAGWDSFGTDQGGNLDADPLFLNPNNPAGADGIHRTADDGLRLMENSPAIDKGTSVGITHNTDITGAAHIGTPDIGAYEGGLITQTITLSPDTINKIYGDADFTLDVTATSGLPVSYTSNNPEIATISGDTVHIVSAGSVEIIVSQAGNGEYAPAPSDTITLIVTPKAITVTANAQTKVYGEADPTLTYTADVELVTGDSFTGELTRESGEDVGEYDINQGTLALSGNYTLTYVGAKLTITPKAITVTANAPTKVYGEADPTLTYTTDVELVTGDSFTGELARESGEDVGEYDINQGTLALSGNYTLTYVGAKFTIMPKAVTGVTLNESAKELFVGEDFTLTAAIQPADATNQNVTWESNNTAVATVDETGKVTAVAKGEATITVTTEDGSHTATCVVTVKETTGIEVVNELSTKVYPTVVSKGFTVETDANNYPSGNIKIYSITGRKIQELQLTSPKQYVNISTLQPSLYLVKVNGLTVKIVKQ